MCLTPLRAGARVARKVVTRPQSGVSPVQGAGPGGELLGVHTLLSNAIAQCDADLRSTLLGATIVTGGSTLMSGFVERIGNEMAQTAASVWRPLAPPLALDRH